MIYSSKKLHLNQALWLHKPIDVREQMLIWVEWRVKNFKKGLGFGQKNRYLVKFCIQNIVLGVSRIKNPKYFPVELFILVFLTKCLSKCPNSTKPPLPLLRTWRKYFDPLIVRTLLGVSFCYRICTNPLGKMTSWGRPQKMSWRPQDVLTWSHM